MSDSKRATTATRTQQTAPTRRAQVRRAFPPAIVTAHPSLSAAVADAGGPVARAVAHRHSVVFTSGGDAADAWMATALFAMLADRGRAQAVLAASLPNARVLSEATAVLHESDVDAGAVVVRKPSVALFASADLVVTLGTTYRRELLKATPQHRREHWLIPSSLGRDAQERARLARDLIRSRVAMLVNIEGWGRADLSRDSARVTRPRQTAEILAAL